jgi:hypothetical protein
MAIHQSFEGSCELAPQRICLVKLPFIKFRAISQAKAGQKIIRVQRNRLCKRLETGIACSAAPLLRGRLPTCSVALF